MRTAAIAPAWREAASQSPTAARIAPRPTGRRSPTGGLPVTSRSSRAPDATVVARISGEAFLTPPGPIYDIVRDAIRAETGIDAELSTSGGTSDARFLCRLCPVVDFGLPNATMHKLDESAAVEDIRALSRIYERTVRKVFG